MVHVTRGLSFGEVDLSDHLIDLLLVECELGTPALANKPVDFERTVDAVKQTDSLGCHVLQVSHKLEHAVVLVILTLEVEVHHLDHEGQSLLQKLHQVVLHRLVQLAEIALDQKSVQLKFHALIRLIAVVLKHVLEQFF